MKKQTTPRRRSSVLFESLESRQLMSGTIATTTTLSVSLRNAVLGQTESITARVTPTSGVAHGTVELLDNNKDTGLTATLNHLGYHVFTLDASQALYAGQYKFSIRYLSAGDFVGSKSRQLGVAVTGPNLTTTSTGLALATVVKGTGSVAKAGHTVTVQYTGFNKADGSEFDDSAAHSPGTFSFLLDDSPEQVIAGFDQEVTGMKVGETRVAVIPSSLGYNDGETRVFVVHLVSIA